MKNCKSLNKRLKIKPYVIVCAETGNLEHYQYYKLNGYNIYCKNSHINKSDGVVVYEAFHVNCPSAARDRQIVLYLAHVYDTKTYLKKFYDKHFRRIFSSAFQWCRQFSRNFPLSPSKYKTCYILKSVFLIFFFYSLDRKLSIFYVGKDSFQRVPETFSARNRMRKSRRIAFPAHGTTRYSARTALASLPNNNLL